MRGAGRATVSRIRIVTEAILNRLVGLMAQARNSNSERRLMQVLIVEDEPEVREELVEMLELRGMDVRGARDFASGLAAARLLAPPAMLLTDLRLPDGSGLDLVRAIRSDPALSAAFPHILLMTGHTDLTEQVERDLAGQEVTMLLKPLDLTELLLLLSIKKAA